MPNHCQAEVSDRALIGRNLVSRTHTGGIRYLDHGARYLR